MTWEGMMITEKDKIEQFKRDLRSYNYYLGMIEECNVQLMAIAVKLQGVSSPSIKDVVLENAGNPYSDNRIGLMMEEGKIIDERNKWLSEVKRLDEMIAKIDLKYKKLILDLYVEKKNHDKVAIENYIGRANMYKVVDKEIKSLFES